MGLLTATHTMHLSPLTLLLSVVIVQGLALPTARTGGGDCQCVCGKVKRGSRIVGGTRAEEHEFPWIATISFSGTFYCGATLITRRHLLTAAHCLYGRKPRELTVTLGEHNRDVKKDGETFHKVKKLSVHANFSIAKIQHDIAIMELERPVNISGKYIRTACLPQNDQSDYKGREGVVAGWGRTSEKSMTSGILRKVNLPLLTREECSLMGYPAKRITETVFCAAHPKGKKDACQGDSGGPMHINGTLPGSLEVIGIVSWGRGCGRPNYPGVYTRIDKYLPWIKEQLGGECMCSPPPSSVSDLE